MIFETHAHYDDHRFDADREALLKSFPEQGITRVINVCADEESLKETPALAARYEFIYAAVGIHPSEISCLSEETLERIRTLAAGEKTVAIGEIGLDYHFEAAQEVHEAQKYWFLRQLTLAEETGLPVIIHSRDAAADTMKLMKGAAEKGIRGVIHCYSYEKTQALAYADMGYLIGVGGVVTFKNGRKLQETVKELPLKSLLLETDAPYLSPEPHRGERNCSLYLPQVVSAIAEIKGVTPEEVEDVTYENAKELFLKSRCPN